MPFSKKLEMPTRESALPGRAEPLEVARTHAVLGGPMREPFPSGSELFTCGMGCFWGAEKKLWQTRGVLSTQVGYSAGLTPNPTYREVCTGMTGHNEVVRAVFDPKIASYTDLLTIFWESHDPTQGMRQGGDTGTQYRSGVYVHDETQRAAALASRDAYQVALSRAGHGTITTEIALASVFYHAEDYHQQYLHKNPDGYCGTGGTGVSCPIGLTSATARSPT